MLIDLRVLELLSSKLCHDLISPVSAINNGVELVEDIGGDVVGEAMELIGNSARQSSHKLKMYRVSYGRAGADANLTIRDVRQIVTQYFDKTKMSVLWPDATPDDAFLDHKGGMKVLVNMFILAEETLAYGGSIKLLPSSEEQKGAVRMLVEGRAAQLSDAFKTALQGRVPVSEITPRTIQAYMTGKFATQYGLEIAYEPSVSDEPTSYELKLSIRLCENQ